MLLVCPENPPDLSSRRGPGHDQSRPARAAGAKGPTLGACPLDGEHAGTDLASLTGIDVPTGLLAGGEGTGRRHGAVPVIDPAAENALTEVADAAGEDALEAARCCIVVWEAAAVLRLQPRQYMRRYATAAPTLAAMVTDEKGLKFDFRILRNFSESSVLAWATNDLMLRTMSGVPEGAALAIRSAIWLWDDEASSLGVSSAVAD